MSLESLLAYMGIDTDLIIIDEINDLESFEGPEFDCS
ncbi:hypothetical protein EV284_3511 [Streptomyces sp. BK022]|nr:hypothetical protein EV284_3511 [Streptomyces sp. BK022]